MYRDGGWCGGSQMRDWWILRVGAILFLRKTNVYIRLPMYTLVDTNVYFESHKKFMFSIVHISQH